MNIITRIDDPLIRRQVESMIEEYNLANALPLTGDFVSVNPANEAVIKTVTIDLPKGSTMVQIQAQADLILGASGAAGLYIQVDDEALSGANRMASTGSGIHSVSHLRSVVLKAGKHTVKFVAYNPSAIAVTASVNYAIKTWVKPF